MAIEERPVIPEEMLRAANRTRELRGFVKPGAYREALVVDGVVAGFVTPHADTLGWRLSPVYVAPEYRRRGLIRRAWDAYRDRVCVAFIADFNEASRAAYTACGFVPWRRGTKGTYYRREPA